MPAWVTQVESGRAQTLGLWCPGSSRFHVAWFLGGDAAFLTGTGTSNGTGEAGNQEERGDSSGRAHRVLQGLALNILGLAG